MANISPLLSVENFGFHLAKSGFRLGPLSFSLHAGERVGIVGASGSGKTLLLRSIMGFYPQQGIDQQGQLSFSTPEGKAISLHELSPKAWPQYRGKDIAYIFQEPKRALNPVLKCGDQVAENLRHHQILSKLSAKSQVVAWFEKVKLQEPNRIYDAYPHQLSGGQLQRVMLASALCNNPKLLLADEPTTAMDLPLQQELLSLLDEWLVEADAALLYVSHDLELVAQLTDSLHIMHQGKIIESGTSKAVLTDPRHPFTQQLVTAYQQISPIPSPSLSSDTPPLLHVRHVQFDYPNPKPKPEQKPLIHDLSFELYEGETLGLVGASGCGKSTLGKLIAGLLTPHQGELLYKDQAYHAFNRKQRKAFSRKIQLVFQDPFHALNPRMKIGEAIKEGIEVHRLAATPSLAKQRVIALLDEVGLSAQAYDKLPHQFSGGERQRIVLARALALEPELLLCDEIVSSLDAFTQMQILELLAQIQAKRKLSLLFIAHNLKVVKRICHRVMVMAEGTLVESAEVSALFQQPQHPYTQRLVEAAQFGGKA